MEGAISVLLGLQAGAEGCPLPLAQLAALGGCLALLHGHRSTGHLHHHGDHPVGVGERREQFGVDSGERHLFKTTIGCLLGPDRERCTSHDGGSYQEHNQSPHLRLLLQS